MRQSTISHETLVEILGDIDDILAARIIETRASEATVVQALLDIEDDRPADEVPAADSPAYTAVRALLEEMVREDDFSYVDHATD